jgi:hypothetical protein
LSATRDSSDGSSVASKLSFRISTTATAHDLARHDPEPGYPGPSSSPGPPPFASLFFPPPHAAAPTHDSVAEPSPAPGPVAPPPPLPFEPSTAEAELKAALPQDTKGEASGKAGEDAEPPPPYTEGSSPLDGFTYVMAAAGGAASILTQVQQGGPAPVNTLSGRSPPWLGDDGADACDVVDVGGDEHINLDLR